MNVSLVLSIFWIVYGILGLFGIENIPEKFKGTEYEKAYKRRGGISWIMLGVPGVILYFLFKSEIVMLSGWQRAAVYLICAIPAVIHASVTEIKFNKLLKNGERP